MDPAAVVSPAAGGVAPAPAVLDPAVQRMKDILEETGAEKPESRLFAYLLTISRPVDATRIAG